MSADRTIQPGKIFDTPYFYQNPGGNAFIKRTENAGTIGDTIIPIIKFVKETVTINSLGQEFSISHGIGRVHEVFGRYRLKTSDRWQMIYSFDSIDEQKVNLTFTGTTGNGVYLYQLFFTSLTI